MARTLSIAGLGAGITAAGAGAAFATDYTVKSGDTLSEIAEANGADWRELARINNLEDPDLILIGQTLKLDGVEKATAPRKVTAKKTETKKVRKTERKTERKARTSRSEDRSSSSVSMSAAWRKVAECESGGNPRAVNPAGYYGLFQFDLQTWRSVGGSGNPAKASAAEQLMRAKKLYAQRGAQPWPVCGRYLR
ncbi:transglycosylase family protein [Kribbella sp. NPDC050470]|uniref:transglycosylase family protein n=1 Tax=unclassified Kribbella TaxID=2644121 RepID=UPI00378FEA95